MATDPLGRKASKSSPAVSSPHMDEKASASPVAGSAGAVFGWRRMLKIRHKAQGREGL